MARLLARMAMQTTGFLFVLALALFGGAGDWRWPSGWAVLGLIGGLSFAVGLWLARRDPGLLEQRLKPGPQPGQRLIDRVFLAAVGLLFLVWVVALGVWGYRLPHAAGSVVLQVLGAVITSLSYAGVAWVFRWNTFAAPVVRVQPERQHAVIAEGPYRWTRHPMYSAGLLLFVGLPLLAGALPVLIALPIWIALLGARAVGEERVLVAELPGYAQYLAKVPWRLVPGVW
jgi:protein-S-isoprenylcysteine O-methyltransferase Ste14